MRRVAVFVSMLVVLLVVALLLVWVFQRRLIYLPDTGPVPSAAGELAGARDVHLSTIDGLRLGAWYLPAASAGRSMTVLVANGNGGDRSMRAPLARALARHGFGVLLFDYRGYGENAGDPSEAGLARDVRAARQFLVNEGVPAHRQLYYGESLGAAVVAELAIERPPAGLVLRSPFTDLASVGQIHYPFLPVRTLLKDRFPVAEQVARLNVPTVVVYGTEDSIVPPEQSREVAAQGRGKMRLVAVAGADHNDAALLDGDELIGAIVELAEDVNRPPHVAG